MSHHNYTVYIIECRDDAYYIGVTNDLDRRLWEHNTGFNEKCFTYKRRPVELKYFETTNDIRQAILREKQLKGWSRKKKEALFKEERDYQNQLYQSFSTTLPFGKLRINLAQGDKHHSN